jgi:hypothetical protein
MIVATLASGLERASVMRREQQRFERNQKAALIEQRHARGEPLANIAPDFGITRQRASQLLRKLRPANSLRVYPGATHTHCRNGHERLSENIRVKSDGSTKCRLCDNERLSRHHGWRERAR